MGVFEIIMAIFGAVMSGASLVSQATANQQNMANAQNILQQQQQFSRESAQTANQTTVEQYNQLYSPAAKMKQLKDAGLSPGLFYSNGFASGGGGSAAQAATPSASVPLMNPIVQAGQMAEMMNVVKTMTEAQKTKAETENIGEQTENLKHTRNLIDKQVEKAETEIKWVEEKTHTEVLTQNKMETENKLLQLEERFQEETFEDRKATIHEGLRLIKENADKVAKEIELMDIDKEYKKKMYEANLKLMKAQENNYIANTALTYAQEKLTEAERKLTNARTSLTHQQWENAKQDLTNAKKQYELMEQEITKNGNEIELQNWELRDYRKGIYHTTHQEGVNKIWGMVEDVVSNVDTWIFGKN